VSPPRKARRAIRSRKPIDLDARTFREAAVFEGLQDAYLKGKAGAAGTPSWPQALLLFEAITDLQDLEGIQATGVVYQDGPAQRLDWVRPDGRRDARHLSCISVLSLDADGLGGRAGGRLVDAIGAWFKESAPRRVLHGRAPAEAAVQCSSAWLRLKLPPHLFDHVMGVTPMTPLQRSTAARLSTGLAMSHEPGAEFLKPASADALDAYFNSAGHDSTQTVLRAVLDAASLKGSSGLTDGALLDRMARRWRRLVDDAEVAGPISSLLVGHVIDLAERRVLVPRSLVAYVKYGAPAVIDGLRGRELEQMTSEELGAAVADGLARQELTGESLRKARAFFGLFLGYVRQWLEVPPVSGSALPEAEEPEVDANVITPQEVDRIRIALQRDTNDLRLSEQTDLVLRLLQHLEVRVSEVFFLQVRNVRISDGVIELEVARQGRLHGLKSPQAQQSRVIHDRDLASSLSRWKQQRRGEGALDPDLLFGSRKAPRRVYRLAAMYAWLNAALKQVSGLRTACCHWLRHAAIDGRYVRICQGLARLDSVEQLSVDAAHLDMETTQRNYLHSYPVAIRASLHAVLRQRRLPSSWAAKWAGVSASKLRQDYHRLLRQGPAVGTTRPASCDEYNWQFVTSVAMACTCEPAAQGFALLEPGPLPELGGPRPPAAADVVGLLLDLQQGVEPLQAGRQWQFDEQTVADVVGRLLELGNASAQLRRRGVKAELQTPKAALRALNIRVTRALQPKYRLWLNSLQRSDVPAMSAAVWQDWTLARPSRYISLEPHLRSDRWLSYLLATGLPVSKLVACQVEQEDGSAGEALQVLQLAVASSAGAEAVTAPRLYEVKPRNGRPDAYLLIADEADELTDQNGAAFSPAGLAALMLALHLYTITIKNAGAAQP